MSSTIEQAIPSHVFRRVERELFDYPVNKQLVLDAPTALFDVHSQGRPPADETGIRPIGVVSDPVNRIVIRAERLEERIARARASVNAIESLLPVMSTEERTLVERYYFDATVTHQSLAREMNMGRTRYYELKTGIIRKFARRFGLV